MTSLPPDQVYYVSPEQIETWRKNSDAVIIDVREQNEWDDAHIPGHLIQLLSQTLVIKT
jgi:rhodanese-related sulfurtransferase